MSKRSESNDRRQWLALGAGVLAVIGLSSYGWIATAAANNVQLPLFQLLSSISDTVFGRPFVLVRQPPIDNHWALAFADWGMKLILALAIFKTIFAVLHRNWRAHEFQKVTAHIVICGAGERGSAIARRKLALVGGPRVAVIDIDPNNDQVGELRHAGAFIVEGNARDVEILQQAGVERASQVIIAAGTDENNLAIAHEVHALTQDNPDWPKIIVGVEGFELRSYFRNRLPKIVANGRVLGFQCRASRRLMSREAERLARDPEVRTRGAVILIEACDAFRDELIRAATVMMQFSAEKLPTLLICGASAEDEQLFSTRFPEHPLVVDLRWSEQRADAVVPESGKLCVDAAIFALKTDSATLEAAERFRIRHRIASQAVIACVCDGDELGHLAAMSAGTGASPCIESLYGLSLGDKDPLDESAEEEGRRLHERYLAEELQRAKAAGADGSAHPANASAVPWAQLSELLRDSNRLAAMHHQIKRAAWDSRGAMDGQEMLVHLARSEHMRWMAEKVMDGWRWSGSADRASRDDARLLHNDLVPFGVLDRHEQEKDLAPVRRALGIEAEVLSLS